MCDLTLVWYKNKNKFIFNHNKQLQCNLVAFLWFYDYEKGIVIW